MHAFHLWVIVLIFDAQASMFRLASEFAFPGKMTKWRFHPQLFKARSTDEKAWVAPFREEFLGLYERINKAIARFFTFS